MSISELETEEDARAWANHPEHAAIQARGRSDYYESYVVYSRANARVRHFARSKPGRRPPSTLHGHAEHQLSAAEVSVGAASEVRQDPTLPSFQHADIRWRTGGRPLSTAVREPWCAKATPAALCGPAPLPHAAAQHRFSAGGFLTLMPQGGDFARRPSTGGALGREKVNGVHDESSDALLHQRDWLGIRPQRLDRSARQHRPLALPLTFAREPSLEARPRVQGDPAREFLRAPHWTGDVRRAPDAGVGLLPDSGRSRRPPNGAERPIADFRLSPADFPQLFSQAGPSASRRPPTGHPHPNCGCRRDIPVLLLPFRQREALAGVIERVGVSVGFANLFHGRAGEHVRPWV